MQMALSGTSVLQYFSTKLRLAKEAGFDSTAQQLLAIWNGLDVDIREHIEEPDETTTIEKFRRKLEERERLWKEKLFKNRWKQQQMNRGNVPPSSPVYDPVIRSSERPWPSPQQNNANAWRPNNGQG
jgi:hypothetical protein